VLKLDIDSVYLRAVSLLFSTIVGLLLHQHAGRGLATAALFGVVTGLVSAFGMLAVVRLVDPAPIIPTSASEWQEAIEYVFGIALMTVVGSALARAVRAAGIRGG
jgi:hypothetical protein